MASRAESEPVEVAEVSLDLTQAHTAPPRPLPARVRLPESMLRYRCNQKGCCCSGWRIAFRGPDLVRLRARLAPDDLDKLTRDVELRLRTDVFGDRVVDEFLLKDADGLCRFLEPDRQRCGLHARYGLEALPDLCVDFPVAAFSEEDAESLYFDPVCPAVLDQLGEGDEALSIIETDPASQDDAFQLRSRHSRGFVDLSVSGARVGQDVVEAMRSAVLGSLADCSRPLWEQLASIETAFVRFGRAPDQPFALERPDELRPFVKHLGACLGAHGRNALEASLRAYRRFIFAVPTDDDAFAWDELGHHLEHWGEAYERWLGPEEEALAPLQRRYLALCYATPYATPAGELARFAGTVTHKLCTALRYAAAIGACLERSVDREVMKVALGASEYFYRSRPVPPELMPWFER